MTGAGMTEVGTALVTGAGGALGSVLCQRALARGWRVLAIDHDARALDELATRLQHAEPAELRGSRLRCEVVDLARPEEVGTLPSLFAADQPLCVAHLAGGFLYQLLHQTSIEQWHEQLRLNLELSFLMVRAFGQAYSLGRSGSFVAVGSVHALRSPAGVGAYAAAKAGVVRLIEAAAAEAPLGARFNVVLPHTMDTPANRAAMPEVDPESWLHPSAAADVILFLLSDAARAVNGAAIELGRRG
jgi:3-oxoacyl-[acyl-carrier protein] reductase